MKSRVRVLSGKHAGRLGTINGDFYNLNPAVSKVAVTFDRHKGERRIKTVFVLISNLTGAFTDLFSSAVASGDTSE